MRLWNGETLFDELFPSTLRFVPPTLFTPATDFGETDAHVWVSVDLPGVAKENIKIEFTNDELHVSAERKGHGKFARSFTLGVPVDAEKIEAVYENGVLKVAIPKAESAKPRQISVKESDGTGFFDRLLNPGKEEKTSLN